MKLNNPESKPDLLKEYEKGKISLRKLIMEAKPDTKIILKALIECTINKGRKK